MNLRKDQIDIAENLSEVSGNETKDSLQPDDVVEVISHVTREVRFVSNVNKS